MRQDEDHFLISLYVYFGMSGLFLLSQRYACFKFRSCTCMFMSVRRGCLLKTPRMLLENSIILSLLNCDLSS